MSASSSTGAQGAPFVHEPRSAVVPNDPRFAYQRWFCGANEIGFDLNGTSDQDEPSIGSVVVFRDGGRDYANLTLSLLHSQASLTVNLTAAALREVAHRLLDAAYDLEAFPAAILKKSEEVAA